MIVTCPSCSSKYRVRDEAVPAEGAELECPSCKAVFVAHPPRKEGAPAPAADSAARQQELESALKKAEGAREELLRQLQSKDSELGRLEARATSAESKANRLEAEVRTLRQQAGDTSELVSVKGHLLDAQRKERTVSAELDVANSLVTSLQSEVAILKARSPEAAASSSTARIEALQKEVQALKDKLVAQVDALAANTSSGPSPSLKSLIAAIGPLLWGLDQALTYIEPFAGNEVALAGHVRQLRLLQKVLQRLVDEAA